MYGQAVGMLFFKGCIQQSFIFNDFQLFQMLRSGNLCKRLEKGGKGIPGLRFDEIISGGVKQLNGVTGIVQMINPVIQLLQNGAVIIQVAFLLQTNLFVDIVNRDKEAGATGIGAD